eukprot:4417834-Amphidinium_carterae.2
MVPRQRPQDVGHWYTSHVPILSLASDSSSASRTNILPEICVTRLALQATSVALPSLIAVHSHQMCTECGDTTGLSLGSLDEPMLESLSLIHI